MNPNRGLILAAAVIGSLLAAALGVMCTPMSAAPTPCISVPSARTGTVVRTTLTGAELAAPQRVHFVLKMRSYEELQARIAKGEVLTLAEMKAKYFPTDETYATVANWATANGYSIARSDPANMTVFTTAPVSQVQATLRTHFARIIGTDGVECTSTADAPVLPAEISGLVAGIPNIHAHLKYYHSAYTVVAANNGLTEMTPQAVANAYNIPAGLNGAGQTIIVTGGSAINPSDLTAFWTMCSLPTTTAQFREIDPLPGNLGPNAAASEETKDIEWSSGMAPAANIIYVSSIGPNEVLSVVASLNDPTIHQVTCSWGLSEAFFTGGATPMSTGETPCFAALAALGITWFNSSGDSGIHHGH